MELRSDFPELVKVVIISQSCVGVGEQVCWLQQSICGGHGKKWGDARELTAVVGIALDLEQSWKHGMVKNHHRFLSREEDVLSSYMESALAEVAARGWWLAKGSGTWACPQPTVSIHVYFKPFPDLIVVSVLAARAAPLELIGCGSLQSSLPCHLEQGGTETSLTHSQHAQLTSRQLTGLHRSVGR